MKKIITLLVLLVTAVSIQAKGYDFDIESNKQKAKQGDEWSKTYLALCYAIGIDVKRDFHKSDYYSSTILSKPVPSILNNIVSSQQTLEKLKKEKRYPSSSDACVLNCKSLQKAAKKDPLAQYLYGILKTGIFLNKDFDFSVGLSIFDNGNYYSLEKDLEPFFDYPLGINMLTDAATQGFVQAGVDLGGLLLTKGKYADPKLAVALLEKYANDGNPSAIKILRDAYFWGGRKNFAINSDMTKLLYWSKIAGEAGDLDAVCDVYQCYLGGHGTEKNVKEAYKWLLKAKKLAENTPYSVKIDEQFLDFDSDGSYFPGIGNFTGATKDIYKKAKGGDVEAMYQLAHCFIDGNGVEKNDKNGLSWLKDAATKGHEQAKVEVKGLEEKQRKEYEAQKEMREKPRFYAYKKKALETGNLHMMLQVASVYAHGEDTSNHAGIEGEVIEQNTDSAMVMYQRMIDACIKTKGNCGSYPVTIASILKKKGQTDKVVPFMKKYADQPTASPEVLLDLGWCYYQGSCTQKNYAMAMKYFKLASKTNESKSISDAAHAMLGIMYFYGRGVARNVNEAGKHLAQPDISDEMVGTYRMGMINGYQISMDLTPGTNYDKEYGAILGTDTRLMMDARAEAFYAYGVCSEKGYGVRYDLSKAAETWERGMKLGNAACAYKIGYHTEKGNFFPNYFPTARRAKALEYYRLAASNGNAEAKAALRRLGY